MTEIAYSGAPCLSCRDTRTYQFPEGVYCVECYHEGEKPDLQLQELAKKVERKPRSHPESDFQGQVIDLLHLHHFKVAHFRPAMNAKGRWRTAVAADGGGFPDVVAIRGNIGIAWELKAGKNKATDEQNDWLHLFWQAGFQTGVYYPEDFDALKELLEGWNNDEVA